jgi:hypothetical protein
MQWHVPNSAENLRRWRSNASALVETSRIPRVMRRQGAHLKDDYREATGTGRTGFRPPGTHAGENSRRCTPSIVRLTGRLRDRALAGRSHPVALGPLGFTRRVDALHAGYCHDTYGWVVDSTCTPVSMHSPVNGFPAGSVLGHASDPVPVSWLCSRVENGTRNSSTARASTPITTTRLLRLHRPRWLSSRFFPIRGH